jgi:hypothetical protein
MPLATRGIDVLGPANDDLLIYRIRLSVKGNDINVRLSIALTSAPSVTYSMSLSTTSSSTIPSTDTVESL